MGFYIDEVSLESHPQVLKIKGHAAELKAYQARLLLRFCYLYQKAKAKSFTGRLIGRSTMDLKEIADALLSIKASVIWFWHDSNKAEPRKSRNWQSLHNSGLCKSSKKSIAWQTNLEYNLSWSRDMVEEYKIYLSGFRSGIYRATG